MIDERTELMINRRFDGELAADQQLDLDKRLIRCPEARAMFEDYQRFDDLARESLAAIGTGEPPRISRRFTFAPRAAIAAAILLVAFLSTSLIPRANREHPTAPPIIAALPIAMRPPMTTIEGPRHENQRVHKDVFGVFDRETQNVYVLEMDQQQTTVVPVSMNY